jgi:hypothetical protein
MGFEDLLVTVVRLVFIGFRKNGQEEWAKRTDGCAVRVGGEFKASSRSLDTLI